MEYVDGTDLAPQTPDSDAISNDESHNPGKREYISKKIEVLNMTDNIRKTAEELFEEGKRYVEHENNGEIECVSKSRILDEEKQEKDDLLQEIKRSKQYEEYLPDAAYISSPGLSTNQNHIPSSPPSQQISNRFSVKSIGKVDVSLWNKPKEFHSKSGFSSLFDGLESPN